MTMGRALQTPAQAFLAGLGAIDVLRSSTASGLMRPASQSAEAAAASGWWLEVLRDLKRINAHLVESAAYPVLKSQGELLPTRLRDNE